MNVFKPTYSFFFLFFGRDFQVFPTILLVLARYLQLLIVNFSYMKKFIVIIAIIIASMATAFGQMYEYSIHTHRLYRMSDNTINSNVEGEFFHILNNKGIYSGFDVISNIVDTLYMDEQFIEDGWYYLQGTQDFIKGKNGTKAYIVLDTVVGFEMRNMAGQTVYIGEGSCDIYWCCTIEEASEKKVNIEQAGVYFIVEHYSSGKEITRRVEISR